MRPIRLTLQAFGPFATREVVDFRDSLEAGLFGVYGQTGAGKSTLFSAMSFALFGAPTKTDQEPRSLRSDFAAPDLPTEVEFVFALGAKTYLIRRRPVQERPKARGEGMTEDAAEAALFDVTGIPVDVLGLRNSGEVIVEKKVTLVVQAVEELLGYGAEQFRQIVLLPQGKFETFLSAKTDARIEILRELFDVKVYREFAAQLQVEASEAEREVRKQREIYVARLQERGFESAEALERGILRAKETLAEEVVREQSARVGDEVARKALGVAEQVVKAFEVAEEAHRTFLSLDEKTDEFDRLAARVNAVTKAMRAHDLEAAWREAGREARAGAEEETEAKAAVDAALQVRDGAAKWLVEVQDGDVRRAKVQADLTKLEEIEVKIVQAASLQTSFEEAARISSLAYKALGAAEQACNAARKERDATDMALESARLAEVKRGKLTSELRTLMQELEQVATYEKAERGAAQAEDEVAKAVAELSKKNGEAEDAETALSEAEARLARTQALILAGKLADGRPCPVCGSEQHPAPAYGIPEQSGLTEAFRRAQEGARQAGEARARAESDLRACKVLLDERSTSLAALPKPLRTQAELEVKKTQLDGDIKALGVPVDLDEMAGHFTDLKRKVSEAEASEAAERSAATKAGADQLRVQAELNVVVEGLPEDLRTQEAVAALRDALLGEQKRLTDTLKYALQKDREAHEALTREEERCTAARAAREARNKREAKARFDFLERLVALGLDETGYAGYQRYFATVEDDRRLVEEHRADLLAARTTWNNAKQQCADRDRPDLGPLKAAQAATSQALREASEALAVAKAEEATLTQFKESLASAMVAVAKLEAETGPLRALADLTNGRNHHKMTLETYAIGAMFDEVLQAANLRLEPMTRGRYRLTRGGESTAGRGKRGLESEIFDINTGKVRSTSTLSGGETFIAALALALGLADVVESSSGKVRMDTIFIDEGFGSLDTENGSGTLDQVLQVLGALTEGSRAVGVISHVGLVQEAIPQGFYVRSGASGSRVEPRRGLR